MENKLIEIRDDLFSNISFLETTELLTQAQRLAIDSKHSSSAKENFIFKIGHLIDYFAAVKECRSIEAKTD